MKIRNGFVSNSSSSSFIINVKGKITEWGLDNYLIKDDEDFYSISLPIKAGTYEFGWEVKRWKDVVSKLNYVVIQAFCSKNDFENREIIKRALQKRICELKGDDVYLDVNWNYNAVRYDSGECWANIDHQSLWYEFTEDECYGIPPVHDVFQSVENMENFLFNSDAYIQGGNDNGGQDNEKYKESLDLLYGKWYGLHRERRYNNWKLVESKKNPKIDPLIEGKCRDCGSPVEYRTIREKETNEVIKTWEKVIEYHDMNGEHAGSDGYYMCSNPDCPNHKRYYVDEYHCDVPYLIRNEESR